MVDQLALFDHEKPKPEKEFRCAGGSIWPCGGTARPGCAGCRKICADGIRSFRASVRAGKYNRAGFTPAEWRAAGYDPAEFHNPKERAFRRKLGLAVLDPGRVEHG
jgi:hypothetical protein